MAPAASPDKPIRAAFVHCPQLEQYHYPPECPFSAERAGKLHRTLTSMGMFTGAGRWVAAPRPADTEALLAFHTQRYLDALRSAQDGQLGIEALEMGLGTEDCPVFTGLYDYAALAAGASLTAAALIADGQADVAFNPSGGYHHARPERAAGFCYINDVVLACLHLTGAGRRVLFLDVDVHHADGVQEAFYGRRDVMTVSFHESGRTLYPGTGFEEEIGSGPGAGYSVNVPLPVGTYDEAYLRAFDALAVPLIGSFEPDVIALELGMDGLAGDPLAHLALTNNAYAEVIQRVLSFGKPVLATGGGGYHVANTVRGWALAWAILSGAEAGGDLNPGLGGVMMETTDWVGGLRDRALAPDERQRRAVDQAIDRTIEKVKKCIFAYHGL
ncbi:MAG: hypothetical protein B1H04_06625 [Planctomycetales bacterium 4484_123]|nr:MAG: hypothetical protein B1H04_06625 [Planctomycetales bacterium 4484_123]